MYDFEKSWEMLKTTKKLIKKLFQYYVVEHPIPLDVGESNAASNIGTHTNAALDDDGDDENWDDVFRLKMKKKQTDVKKTELERYLEDDVEDSKNIAFDILRWWKMKTEKYYVISYMTRDILAIPMSIVSSESAFSTGGRVLDSFRSCLHPTTVQALICTHNWIKTRKTIDLRVEMDEVQQIESEISGLCSTEV